MNASCTQDGECALLYSTFATPVITSLTPSELTSGTEITVTGFSFGGANEVNVTPHVRPLRSLSSSSIS